MRIEHIGEATLYTGDVLECLRELPDESVHCIVTSPPYWGLRNYDIPSSVWDGKSGCVHEWGNSISGRSNSGSLDGSTLQGTPAGEERRPKWISTFCQKCGAWLGVHGLEPTPELYVKHEVQIFHEAHRVLRKDGTLWLNLGDCYHSGDRGGYRNDSHRWENCPLQSQAKGTHLEAVSPNRLRQVGLKDKDLVGIPWRVAFALQADGWYLRSDIIWAKPNPMPESVTDRPTKAHEYLFLLSKSPRYFYDAEAIREPHISEPHAPGNKSPEGVLSHHGANYMGMAEPDKVWQYNPAGRNRRTVWTIATQPFPEAHFATFPEKLVEPCILAGCPAQVCPECGAPWERVVEKNLVPTAKAAHTFVVDARDYGADSNDQGASRQKDGHRPGWRRADTTLGFRPTCACGREDTVPGTMLDPFCGAGTALLVALRLGRRAIGIDLKPEYMDMTRKRIAEEAAQRKLI